MSRSHSIRFISVITVAMVLCVVPAVTRAATWGETQPAGDVNKTWFVAGSDADGSVLLAGTTARLYLSTNGGTSWAETQPAGDTDQAWTDTAIDADGSNLFTGAYGGRLYVSTNSGTSWSETQPAGNVNAAWQSLASDNDGSNLFAAVYNGRLYISTNSGTSWSETQPKGNVNGSWQAVASDADGSVLVAAEYNGRIYISTNGGTSWTETQPAGNVNGNWYGLAVSEDGSKIVMSSYGGRMYISTNSGSSWTETQPAGNVNHDWYDIEMSGDGEHIIAGIDAGRLYVSTDGGDTWSEEQPAGASNLLWESALAMSRDGTKAIAGNFDGTGRLYSGTFSVPDTTPPTITITGSNPDEILLHNPYVEPGATATDDTDGDLTSDITTTGSVDTDTIGAYSIVYSVSDAALNTAYATRTVDVISRGDGNGRGSSGSHHTDTVSLGERIASSTASTTPPTDDIARLEHLITILTQILNFLMGKGVLPR